MQDYSHCYTVFSTGQYVLEHLKFAKPPIRMEPVKPDQQSRSGKTSIKDEVEMNVYMAEMEKYESYLDLKRQFQTEDNEIVRRFKDLREEKTSLFGFLCSKMSPESLSI